MRALFALLCLVALVAIPVPIHAAALDCSSANAAVALQLQRGVWDADLAHALQDAYDACQGATPALPVTFPEGPEGTPIHPPINPLMLEASEDVVNRAQEQGCGTASNTYPATYSLMVAGPSEPPFSPGALDRYDVSGTVLAAYDPATSPHTSVNGQTNDLSFGLYADSTHAGWVYLYDAPVPGKYAELGADCAGVQGNPVCEGSGYTYAWAGLYQVIASVTFNSC